MDDHLPRGPVLGQGRALGHDLVDTNPQPSGWRAHCECGEVFRGRWEMKAVAAWNAHVNGVKQVAGDPAEIQTANYDARVPSNAAGAPPRDWWHHVDAVLDAELAARAGKYNGGEVVRVGRSLSSDQRPNGGDLGNPDKPRDAGDRTVGAQGVHLRRALERAGILSTVDALDVSPKGYAGAHYAVWPPELVRLLVDEMCPRRVCTTCGEASRRIVEADDWPSRVTDPRINDGGNGTHGDRAAKRVTVGWSDCGHGTWRPGRVLDPFVGSGTTLAVCSGMGRDAVGIDLDERNADLARERVGMFLEVDYAPVVA